MKPIYAILILLLGCLLTFLGTLLKKESWEGASSMLGIGTLTLLLGAGSLIYQRNARSKD